LKGIDLREGTHSRVHSRKKETCRPGEKEKMEYSSRVGGPLAVKEETGG